VFRFIGLLVAVCTSLAGYEAVAQNPSQPGFGSDQTIASWPLPSVASTVAAPSSLSLPRNPPIYSEVIPTSYHPKTESPQDWKEEFTAPNGRTIIVLVQAPVGSGTYSRAMRSDETPDTYFPAIVSEALASGADRLVIPKRTYDFVGPDMTPTGSCNVNVYYNCAPHWLIAGQNIPAEIHDLTIDGSGSMLNFNAPSEGIQIYNVARLRLTNFTINWPKTPMAALGTVVADPTNPGHHAVVIDDSFPVSRMNPNFTINGYPQIQAINLWVGDGPSGHFDPSAGNNLASDEVYFIFGIKPARLPKYVGKTSAGNQTYSCKDCGFVKSKNPGDCSFYNNCANFDYFPVGSRVVVRYLTYNGQAIGVSFIADDVDIDNITLLSSPGMGITDGSNGGHRGFRLANSVITRAPGQPVSTVADSINVADLAGDILITNNEVGYQGDDSIAVYSETLYLTAVENLTASGGTIVGDSSASCAGSDPGDLTVGDWIAFFDQNQNYLDSAKVASISQNCSGTSPALQFSFDHCSSGNCSGALSQLNSSGSFTNLSEQASPRFLISGNYAHDCRCHGAVTSAPYGQISDNRFDDTSAPNLFVGAGSGLGMGSSNLMISGNTLTESGLSSSGSSSLDDGAIFIWEASGSLPATPIFQKIIISRNTIRQQPGPAILFTSAGEIVVGNNVIEGSNLDTTNPAPWGSLSTLDSILMVEDSYGIVCGTQVSGTSSGPIGIDPSDVDVHVGSVCY
jgi:Right handed beta helix region